MPVSIRRAIPADWPVIAEFNCRLAEETEGKRLNRSDVEAGVRALLGDPRKGRYLVAVVDVLAGLPTEPLARTEGLAAAQGDLRSGERRGQAHRAEPGQANRAETEVCATPPAPPFLWGGGGAIVGQLMHTFAWSDWRNGDIWWLQSVYVHPDFRRRGVFRALFDHLRREAEADPGVVGLRLYVEEHNTRAHSTYQSLGLTPGGYVVMEQMLRRSNLSI